MSPQLEIFQYLRQQLFAERSASASRGKLETLQKNALFIAMVPVFTGLLLFLLIAVVVDPYDLREWGMKPQLATDHRYPDSEWPLFLKVIAKGDHKLVLVGASTMMGITGNKLDEIFGKDSKAVNLSYPLAAPKDTGETLSIVSQMSELERVILVVDHSQMLPAEASYRPAQIRKNLLSTDWHHSGDFNWTAAKASLNRVYHGTYRLQEWKKLQRPEFYKGRRLSEIKEATDRIQLAIEKHKDIVLGPKPKYACEKYPFINQIMVPSLQELTRRNVQVDLLFPPYLYVNYYDWIDRRFVNDPFPTGPVFPSIISFRYCITQAAEEFDGKVTVSAFDNIQAIGGEASNFADTIHVIDDSALNQIFEGIRDGTAKIGLQDFESYQTELTENILNVRTNPKPPFRREK